VESSRAITVLLVNHTYFDRKIAKDKEQVATALLRGRK
jgi:hypothetical protein